MPGDSQAAEMKENTFSITFRVFSRQHLSIDPPPAITIQTLLHFQDVFKCEVAPTRAQTVRNFSPKRRQQCRESRAPSCPTGNTSTCGMTTWTWAESWRSCAICVRGTPEETPRDPWEQQPEPQPERGATSRPPGGSTARTMWGPNQWAACRTAAPPGLLQTSAASASRTGSLHGCTAHTSWNLTTGKSSAPSSGTTPAPSAELRGIRLTRAATARRRNSRTRRGSCQAPGSGRTADDGQRETDDTVKTVHNYEKMFRSRGSCLHTCCGSSMCFKVPCLALFLSPYVLLSLHSAVQGGTVSSHTCPVQAKHVIKPGRRTQVSNWHFGNWNLSFVYHVETKQNNKHSKVHCTFLLLS